ncbi:TonB-dependent receptor domain-containing protein [Leucothrix arctica]|uniref:TonB-dependent receptor n=1 Tax=Leucothrix arctica TaxID=1481894 RepID=A0A317C909_9GAMM|nr:TonB-dependent receptor [Leucothrix arctica]PWQ95165.1 TonB-dependent receptor [Leucothrix arctica]
MVNTKKSTLGKTTLLAASISLALMTTHASAEEVTTFDTIVVVGETTNTEVTPEELDNYQANDLEDIFRHVPSVSVGGSVGIAQKVYVRGMEDTMLNVSVDGAPQTGTLFHHIGRIQIEPELLKSVEVQAGAGEATSGAGAIGGAIRFETKDVEDLLETGKKFGGLIKGSAFSNEGEKGNVSLYGKVNDNVGVIGSFSKTNRDNMTDGNGDEILATNSKQNLAFVKVNADISDKQELSISAEKREESGEFSSKPNWFVSEGDALYPMERDRTTFTVNHKYTASDLFNLETTVYRTNNSLWNNGRFGEYEGHTQSTGLDLKNKSHLGNHTVTYGIDYRKDIVTAGASSDNGETFKEKGTVFGAYAQDHWQLSDKLLVSYGLRFDDYKLDQTDLDDSAKSDAVSPNIGLSYDINDKLTVKVGHAKAMRGKEISDSFTVDGFTLGEDLRAEKVTNTEIGLEYNTGKLNLTASVYQSEVKDVIHAVNGWGGTYENIGNLESDGFELGASYDFGKLELAASFSHNDPTLNGNVVEGYEHSAIGNVRGDTFNVKATYEFSSQFQLGWNFAHVKSLNDIEVLYDDVAAGWIDETQFIDKKGYNVHDVYLRWTPNRYKNLSVNFAVQNLFDENYRDHSSVGDYGDIAGWESIAGANEAGRDVRLSVNYKF